ncbi:hypothetical protein M413DRAFT_20913 [Hebeloma cylindrosporum]|uniref:ZNF598/HEL2 PAH domain-containing protein n=1 Tax=Hebeloma cylindrosporum TaxID=76867 RepID=A0A0C3CXI9_HEBCY|nr:hypothetical protein M413DRAFT_20913 [Hebeloma cylindrosporum h7]
MVEEHGGDMSARDKKDARRIQADFTFENVGQGGRHGHGGRRRDRERDRDRDREREPPPHQQQQAVSSTPVAAAAPAARPPGVGRRREGFGAALTQPDQGTSATTMTTNAAARNTRPTSPQVPTTTSDIDPAIAERHASFLARLQSLALNPATAVPAVKSATRSYRLTESTSRDLILTIWNVVDRNLEHTASLVNAFIDLLEEEEKKQDLLASWKGFAIEQRRQFPDLTPTSVGEGYAGITSGRVLNAKHSTATRSSQSQQVWNRVALAAGEPGTYLPLNSNLSLRHWQFIGGTDERLVSAANIIGEFSLHRHFATGSHLALPLAIVMPCRLCGNIGQQSEPLRNSQELRFCRALLAALLLSRSCLITIHLLGNFAPKLDSNLFLHPPSDVMLHGHQATYFAPL